MAAKSKFWGYVVGADQRWCHQWQPVEDGQLRSRCGRVTVPAKYVKQEFDRKRQDGTPLSRDRCTDCDLEVYWDKRSQREARAAAARAAAGQWDGPPLVDAEGER